MGKKFKLMRKSRSFSSPLLLCVILDLIFFLRKAHSRMSVNGN